MNQTPLLKKLPKAWLGAIFMVLAGCAFSGINVITQIVTGQMGFKPTSDAFWQYFIALVFSLPFLFRRSSFPSSPPIRCRIRNDATPRPAATSAALMMH